jgi:acetyl esterase
MWQTIKVWFMRLYYRVITAMAWRRHPIDPAFDPLQIPGDAGPIHARLYRGASAADKPLIIFFHGGGWVIGDTATHHPFCQTLCQKSGGTIISIDYRLAPEHPFPAAADDCHTATRWIAEHIGDFGPSNHRLVLAGDSAGANLATGTCLEIDEPARSMIAGEILIYPVTEHYSAGFASYVEKATGQTLTANFMFWFWNTYLGPHAADSVTAARAFPLRSDNIAALPPTFMATAENDPLRDEGIAYAEKLREAGVTLQYRHFGNAAHGFACSEGPNPDFNALMDDLEQWLVQLPL